MNRIKYIFITFLMLSGDFLFAQQQINADSLQNVFRVGHEIFYSYPDSALKIFDKAEKIAIRTIRNPTTPEAVTRQLQKYLASSYYDRGIIYDQKGDPSKAVGYYNQALRIYESTDRKYGIAGVLNRIGNIYQRSLNDSVHALDCYLKALKLYEELADTPNTAVMLSNVGSVYKMTGNVSVARQYYLRSLKINERINNRQGIAQVSKLLAVVYKDDGHLDNAAAAANRSLKLYKETGDKEGSAEAMILLGNIYYAQANVPKAKEMALQAMNIAGRNNYRNIIKEAALLLEKLYKEEDKYQEALHMNDLYNSMRDTIENKDVQTKVIRDLVYFENRNKALIDSIKFVTAQQEKDHQIQEQQILIESHRKLRNAFIVIGLFILIGGFLLFNRYRLQLRLKENQLQVNALETQQKLLRAQMNPHFINNALNSIQSLILGNETQLAGEYLATFSRLTRAILEQTRKQSIPLSKEVETLGMYMEMEKLRFDNKFDYEIILPETINPENVYIPPLIIQPFVENSILHGIIHKKDKGKVSIEFAEKDDAIICTVVDDGVGRAKSREINSRKSKPGNSLATQLAQSRLALINNNGHAISITDLKDETGNACGTKVVLSIPLLN